MAEEINAFQHPVDRPAGDQPFEAVETESASFQQFERWLDMELARLVQTWIHTAAPNASRPRDGRERFGR
jgi:hypothetical protein